MKRPLFQGIFRGRRVLQPRASPNASRFKPHGAIQALRTHWPEYLMEGAALGMFMVSACVFGVLLQDVSGLPGRILGAIAMGLTAVAIISSPWGQRSGAHMNPAVTLTFLSLGKIAPWGAFFYVAGQFAGGVAGVLFSAWIVGPRLEWVHYVATVPGLGGPWAAFAAEFTISFLLIAIILNVSNSAEVYPIHTLGRRLSGGHLYQRRIAALRDEHESGAHRGLRFSVRHMDRDLGVLPGAGTSHDFRRADL
jgi:glycerol uptake facilitator-like aquaporin